jgi:hypothetical protein
VLGYNRLVSKFSVRTEEEKLDKMGQVQTARRKLLSRTSITGEIDMGWWRTCTDEALLVNDGGAEVVSETATEDIRGGTCETPFPMSTFHPNGTVEAVVSRLRESTGDVESIDGNRSRERGALNNKVDAESGGSGEVNMDDDEGMGDPSDEDMYGIFRNDVGKKVWECYHNTLVGLVKGKDRKEQDGDEEDGTEVEWSITAVARIDAWIMSVVALLGDESKRGGGLQKKYVQKYEEYLPIAMGQLSRSLYLFVKKWEPNDLKVWFNDDQVDGVGREDVLEHIFRRPYAATVPVHDVDVDKVYLTIERSWFNTYVSRELTGVTDAYVAVLSSSMTEFIPLS